MKYIYALFLVMFIAFLGYTINNVMTFAENVRARVNVINHALEGK